MQECSIRHSHVCLPFIHPSVLLTTHPSLSVNTMWLSLGLERKPLSRLGPYHNWVIPFCSRHPSGGQPPGRLLTLTTTWLDSQAERTHRSGGDKTDKMPEHIQHFFLMTERGLEGQLWFLHLTQDFFLYYTRNDSSKEPKFSNVTREVHSLQEFKSNCLMSSHPALYFHDPWRSGKFSDLLMNMPLLPPSPSLILFTYSSFSVCFACISTPEGRIMDLRKNIHLHLALATRSC